ncbi:hypothetical protein CBS63078_10890 [Aspergillus niger]|nr:hypothetical protein CBS63078_10890 [Aspergillus niger]KAI2974591.1 hypothetical protein CBS147323_1251 [Aspergillus niger]KAI3016258.1 hypothetical protein CBS147345_4717 [Aspergillus niger]KAI3023932.1 hypothetical protein CBS147347_6458 [Aspergillus niger]KAI3086064.1 hypothetical protein CBS147353_1251 [Aspergillus niger]
MTRSSRAEIIEQEPIGAGMDAFRAKLALTCEDLGLPYCVNSLYDLEKEARMSISLDLVVALQALPASRRREPDDSIWDKVYAAAAESTPHPQPASYFKHIPYSHSTSASPNFNDYVDDIDAMLEEDLDSIFTDVPGFDEAYFGAVEGLKEVAAVVFNKLRKHDVQIQDKDDDTQGAVRKGLDLRRGRRYHRNSNIATLDLTAEPPKSGHSTSSTGQKRTSSHLSPPGLPTKRTCPSSQATSDDGSNENRVHRRVVNLTDLMDITLAAMFKSKKSHRQF